MTPTATMARKYGYKKAKTHFMNARMASHIRAQFLRACSGNNPCGRAVSCMLPSANGTWTIITQ
jgi:hypothetical protein